MSVTVDQLNETLAKLDQSLAPIAEEDVSNAVRALWDRMEAGELPMQWTAEVMAFEFCEDFKNKQNGWGTYYGPMAVWANKDGTYAESPSITKVTPEVVQYWSHRATAAKHPVMRIRYADLVWDLSKVATKISAHYSMAHVVIDSTTEIAQGKRYKREVDGIKKLERALDLALMLKDASRIETTRDAIIDYEDAVSKDSQLGLWGFAYDALIENNKVQLTSGQEVKLITDLEGHLLRASRPDNPENVTQWEAEASALRLAKYYRKTGKGEEVRRVMLEYQDSFIKSIGSASPLQASFWLQSVHSNLREYGLLKESDKIAVILRELGDKVKSEMKSISHSVTIKDEDMDKYITSLTEGNLDQALARIVERFTPKKAEVERQLSGLANTAPIQFLITSQVQDSRGRPVATIGPLEDDLTGHVMKQISFDLHVASFFLSRVFESLVAIHPQLESSIPDHLFRSPAFEEDKKPIVVLGVKSYFRKEYVSAAHILVPQIENGFRALVEKAGGSIFKASRLGGFNLKTLDDLLREQSMKEVFGEDAVLYFRVLLIDARGWNLRNRVCHGLCGVNEFGATMCDRLIHVMLCLAQVRVNTPENSSRR